MFLWQHSQLLHERSSPRATSGGLKVGIHRVPSLWKVKKNWSGVSNYNSYGFLLMENDPRPGAFLPVFIHQLFLNPPVFTLESSICSASGKKKSPFQASMAALVSSNLWKAVRPTCRLGAPFGPFSDASHFAATFWATYLGIYQWRLTGVFKMHLMTLHSATKRSHCHQLSGYGSEVRTINRHKQMIYFLLNC